MSVQTDSVLLASAVHVSEHVKHHDHGDRPGVCLCHTRGEAVMCFTSPSSFKAFAQPHTFAKGGQRLLLCHWAQHVTGPSI
jgi:hypothetical protein